MRFISRGVLTTRRPEKDHAAQLHAFSQLLSSHPEYGKPGDAHVQLVLVGGSRNEEDAARVEGLRALAKELGIEVFSRFYSLKLADHTNAVRAT